MAFGLVKINTLDLKPSTGIGVAIPFSSDSVFTTVYNTTEQLKYNLINFLLTNRGERIFNPNFGANLRNQLFEQITQSALDSLDQQIRGGIQMYFPSIVVEDLSFGGNTDKNELTITLTYSIKNTGAADTIVVSLI